MPDKNVTDDTALTSNTTPATTDRLLLVDDGTDALQDITLANALKVVNELTADGSPDLAADYLLSYDASAGAAKKVLLNLVGGGIQDFAEINDLTEDTAPDRTADFVATYDTGAAAAKKVLLNRLGAYQLNVLNTTTFNPADATTYYIGALGAATTSADQRRFYILRAGKITRAAINFRFTAGSNQTSTISFRLNNTTDTTLSSTVDLSSAGGNFYQVVTGLSIAVAQDDYFEIKWVTPTWNPTDPTNVLISVTLLFE